MSLVVLTFNKSGMHKLHFFVVCVCVLLGLFWVVFVLFLVWFCFPQN